MTEYTWASDLVSDLHKEAHGFRPSKDFFVETIIEYYSVPSE